MTAQKRKAKPKMLKCQVVVIGAGGGGLPAAVAAAEKGADVVLLEKRRFPGGNAKMSNGMFAAESHVQRRMHIIAPRDKLFKIMMGYAHWKSNPRIIRAFIDKSADSIRWLESMGLSFDVRPYYPGQNPAVYHVPEGEGPAFVKVLVKKCKELGVHLLCSAGAKKIVTNDNGSVIGVVATTKGQQLEVTADCVIIATGGYGGNRKLLKKYYPFYTDNLHVMGLPHMGDGIQMAMDIGAADEDLGTMHIGGPCFPNFSPVAYASREPNTIWVNKIGERFVDESITFYWPESGNALDRQPDKISFTLFDEKIKKLLSEDEGIKGGISLQPPGTKLIELGKALQKESGKGGVMISSGWKEIAEWMEAAPKVLMNTIKEYNRFCDQRHDQSFAKDPSYLLPLRTPPFYALRCVQVTHNTLGGIKINHHMEVLNRQDNPIPGLYAVGTDTGGWVSDTYCLILSGNAFGFAVTGGRIAAQSAIKYISEKGH